MAAARTGRWSSVQSHSPSAHRSLLIVFVGRYLLRANPDWLDERTLLVSILMLPVVIPTRPEFVGIP